MNEVKQHLFLLKRAKSTEVVPAKKWPTIFLCVCVVRGGATCIFFKVKKWHIGKKGVLDKEKKKLSDRIQNIEEKFQSHSQITE